MSQKRPRQLASGVCIAMVALVLVACGQQYPNTTFTNNTDFNSDIYALWNRLLLLGTIVFVFVEALLLFTVFKFRRREGAPAPRQTHGNASLEIAWTIIPALILAMIAVPTVKTIWKTQAPAPAGAIVVQVIGHQWWWEFRYPQYGVVTANELYLPVGRTASFELTTRDVLHSFWAPQLGGKRDLITNHTNLLWYTPRDSLAGSVFNGFCTEYCGSSHANMRLRVYTVTPAQFESWAAHQANPAALSPAPAAAVNAPVPAKPAVNTASLAGGLTPPAPPPPAPVGAVAATEGYVFPRDKLNAWNVPMTPFPTGSNEVKFDDSLLAQGDAARGHELVGNMANMSKAPCLTCHIIKGEYPGVLKNDDMAKAPNLTHFATRHTFAGGVYNTDARTLARWVKNAPHMKPGSLMPTLGLGEYNPDPLVRKIMATGLDDRQIADIVAYLMSLK
ncbi:MAG TPA: cytochrome c oxidase subunit II [Gemmatimonadaceae bacterium]|nr:cytochrome c oxidase subunit II [Gemmatimonadaceae bacterium]